MFVVHFNNTDYTAPYLGTISEWWIEEKDVEGSGCGLIYGTIQALAEGLSETTKNLSG
jgi:hypothetical protein